MIKGKNKIYIGSSKRGYLNEEMISMIYDYLANQETYEYAKAKPRKSASPTRCSNRRKLFTRNRIKWPHKTIIKGSKNNGPNKII